MRLKHHVATRARVYHTSLPGKRIPAGSGPPGEYWKRLVNFDLLVEEGAISPDDLDLFKYVDEPEQVWEGIRRYYNLPDVCDL